MVFCRGRIRRSGYGKHCCELFQFDGRARRGFSLRGHRAEMWNGARWVEKNLDVTSVAQTRNGRRDKGLGRVCWGLATTYAEAEQLVAKPVKAP